MYALDGRLLVEKYHTAGECKLVGVDMVARDAAEVIGREDCLFFIGAAGST